MTSSQAEDSGPLVLRFSNDSSVLPEIVAGDKRGEFNFLLGDEQSNWRTSVPGYGFVRIKDVASGVDVVIYGTDSGVEYDMRVSPGADLQGVQVLAIGAESAQLQANGALEIRVDEVSYVQRPPVAYQVTDHGRVAVRASTIPLAGGNGFGFVVDEYDSELPLIIDPVVELGTHAGGGGADRISAIHSDAAGAIYLSGWTTSDDFDFFDIMNGVPGAVPERPDWDAFIAKLDPRAGVVTYFTYYGGSGDEKLFNSVLLDSGEVVLVGNTSSLDLPTVNPIQASCPNDCSTEIGFPNQDGDIANKSGFVAKLAADGASLIYSTYFGGGTGQGATNSYGDSYVSDVATDENGAVWITGWTGWDDFPVTAAIGANQCFQQVVPSFQAEGFVALIGSAGTLDYAACIPSEIDNNGHGEILPRAMARDSTGNIYVGGEVTAPPHGITLVNSYAYPGPSPGSFVARFNPNATDLLSSSNFGGTIYDLDVGLSGELVVAAEVSAGKRCRNSSARQCMAECRIRCRCRGGGPGSRRRSDS